VTDVLMPALSPTMEEGTLAKWCVKVGDTVKSGDVIAEIETDKATMEVEAVDEGVVEAILVPEGAENVKVNAPIARLSGGENAVGQTRAPAPAPSQVPVATAAPRERAAAPTSPPAMNAEPMRLEEGVSARIAASPLARRVASQKGLDLATLKGSGPRGRIILRDVETAIPNATPLSAPEPAAAPARPREAVAAPEAASVRSLEQMGIPAGSYDLRPLDGMRRTVARRMTESFRDIPHFPLSVDIEIDNLLATRATLNGVLSAEGVKVSVNDMIIKAAAVALGRVPEANASYSPEGLAFHHHADIAVAVAIDGGLITPIVRAAETKGVARIATEMKDLAERARTRKLKPEEFQGGTFSISNLGMFGVKAFASIINAPQGAILSVGAGERRPVVRGEELAIATVMSVTLTCDHRVVDGAIGARWLAAFKGLIENPITMIV
jgi:pyruvate dehydrogenase E2 component (dihydrolipoamide acetyltransferase)